MNFQKVEHLDLERIRDRYYWHITHLVLFSAMTFVFSVTELTFDISNYPARKVAAVKETAENVGLSEALRPILDSLQKFQPNFILQNYKLIEGADKIEIHFGTAALYEPGRADFVAGASEELRRLGRILSNNGQNIYVKVEGHTDDVPVVKNAWKYPTNWELSSARASNVVRAFLAAGLNPDQLEAVGRAEAIPMVPNRSPAGEVLPDNQIVNRRIVISISVKNPS